MRPFKFDCLSKFHLYSSYHVIHQILKPYSSYRNLLLRLSISWEVAVIETTKHFLFACRWNRQLIKQETSSALTTGKGRVWTLSCSPRLRRWQMCPWVHARVMRRRHLTEPCVWHGRLLWFRHYLMHHISKYSQLHDYFLMIIDVGYKVEALFMYWK